MTTLLQLGVLRMQFVYLPHCGRTRLKVMLHGTIFSTTQLNYSTRQSVRLSLPNV